MHLCSFVSHAQADPRQDEEWEAARQNWKAEWNQFTEQRDLEFKTQLADLTQRNLQQLQQQFNSELVSGSSSSRVDN